MYFFEIIVMTISFNARYDIVQHTNAERPVIQMCDIRATPSMKKPANEYTVNTTPPNRLLDTYDQT